MVFKLDPHAGHSVYELTEELWRGKTHASAVILEVALSQIKRDLIPVVVVVVVVVYEAQLGAESAPSLTILVFRIS